MIAETKKAVALTTAKNNKLQNKAYPKAVPLSSLKIQVGEILLSLQKPLSQAEQICWQDFESKLRQYLYRPTSKVSQGIPESVPDGQELKNSKQEESE